MVRTADTAIKTGGKNTKVARSTPSTRTRSPSTGPSTDKGYNSYNSVCHRETPNWQKPITSFFQNVEKPPQHTSEPSISSNSNDKIKNNVNADEVMEEDVPVSYDCEKMSTENRPENGVLHNEIGDDSLTKKIKARDDDYDLVPKKKRKLDADVYAQLQTLEM